ncbi:MAG: ATP-binding protein [Pirellulaceae bacterium]|jgi:PAS domain S-box-containing protein
MASSDPLGKNLYDNRPELFGKFWGHLGRILLFAIAFFLFQRLTFLLRFPPYQRTTVWVPGALTFSALLIWPLHHWWNVFLGLCLGAVAAYHGDPQIPGSQALLIAPFHFATVAATVWVVRRWCSAIPFATVPWMLVFVVAAGVVVPLATSLPGDLVRLTQGKPDVLPIAIRSILCVALGMLIATPAFTSLLMGGWRQWRDAPWIRVIEGTALALCLLATAGWVFTTPSVPNQFAAFVYAPIPLLVWAALRFEVAGVSWALLAIAYLSTGSAIQGMGPFVQGLPDNHVLQLQLFLLALSLPLLFMAVGVQERRQAYGLLLQEMDQRRRTEERFRLVVESTPSAMLMVDARGRIELANHQTGKLFGYREEQLIGQPMTLLIPTRFHASQQKKLENFFSAPALRRLGFESSLTGLTKQGTEFPMEIILTPIESGGGLMALVAVIDNTEKQRAEEARRELVHASRLAVLSELTASIAHEINQPLGAILSNAEAAELLLEDPSPSLDEVRRILSDIRKDDLRASEVIRRLRALLRQGEVERQPIGMQLVISDVVAILRGEAERRGVEMAIDSPTPDPMAVDAVVLADRIHLQQVMLNLMVNALEAMSEQEGPKRLRISSSLQDNQVVVSIQDNGPGVPESVRNKLFDRFFSTKREGMGMGLAISRSLIEEHGGRIWMDIAPEGGAVFHFSLPLAPHSVSSGTDMPEEVMR